MLDRPASGNSNTKAKPKKRTKSQEDRTPIAADDDELELEKLVFGDLSGFRESLRQNGDEEGFLSGENDDESDDVKGNEEEAGPGRDLTALHDDEVGCKAVGLQFYGQLAKIFPSYFLQMLALAMLTPESFPTKIRLLLLSWLPSIPWHLRGRIAMMNV